MGGYGILVEEGRGARRAAFLLEGCHPYCAVLRIFVEEVCIVFVETRGGGGKGVLLVRSVGIIAQPCFVCKGLLCMPPIHSSNQTPFSKIEISYRRKKR